MVFFWISLYNIFKYDQNKTNNNATILHLFQLAPLIPAKSDFPSWEFPANHLDRVPGRFISHIKSHPLILHSVFLDFLNMKKLNFIANPLPSHPFHPQFFSSPLYHYYSKTAVVRKLCGPLWQNEESNKTIKQILTFG